MLDSQQVPPCAWCDEPILRGEDSHSIPLYDGKDYVTQTYYHHECRFRLIAGSLAHIEGRCDCFVEGSTESDPEGMTLREAARAALAAWKRLHQPTDR